MDHFTGSGSTSVPSPGSGGDKPPHTYLGVARSMLEGVTVLASAKAIPALNLVAGHALECMLKAYLTRDGKDRWSLRHHNLVRLWRKASCQGLRIASSPPEWVVSLNKLHNKPYRLRYPEGIQGTVGPNIQAMTTELASVLETVRAQLSSPP